VTKSRKKPKTSSAPIQNSWEIWTYLAKNAGLDSVYYDNEFLDGNSSFNGLSQHLGFKVDKENIVSRLQKHKVSAEKFIGAFFKVLQPYAQMMNDLCVFFSNHKVNETNESLKIVFDFGKVSEQIDFNLENFRSILTTYTTVKKKLTYYHVDSVWELHEIFRSPKTPVDRKSIADKKARKWVEAYDNNQFLKPDLVAPVTGYNGLDLQLKRVIDLWADYVITCMGYSENVQEFKSKLYHRDTEKRDGAVDQENLVEGIDLTLGWNPDGLSAELDRWSARMIELLFGAVESINKLTGKDRDVNAANLEEALQDYFDGLPRSEAEYDDLVAELTELLNLPVWKKRYELFSTWVLSALDQTFAGYDRVVHANKGVLLLNFSATHLMTIQSAAGPFELWAENRTLAKKLTGHGRKRAIQPDYTIYEPTVGDPIDCIVCVEVKQYKKASVANFKNAINDYANGLPNAHVFLVNYGPKPASLVLDHPVRSSYYGEVRPASSELSDFRAELLAALPLAKPLSPKEIIKTALAGLSIDNLFVDVSGSMDTIMNREYIRSCLDNLVQYKRVLNMVAVDDVNKISWKSPNQSTVAELLLSHFYSGNDFAVDILNTGRSNLIITDQSGAQDVWGSGFRPVIILLGGDDAELWIFDETLDTYLKQHTEPLEIGYDHKQKGFEGWLFNSH
jgi:hypothetical protein